MICMMDAKPPLIIKGRPITRERTRPRLQHGHVPRSRRSGSRPASISPAGGTPALIIKSAAAVIIALLVLLFNSINLPFARGVISHIKTALTYEPKLEDLTGGLKFVGSLIPSLESVFGEQDPQKAAPGDLSFSAPVNGKVIRLFKNEGGAGDKNSGIDILAEGSADFYTCEDGKVAAIEEDETYGKSLWLDHGNGVFSFYGGVDELIVEEGQKVKRGSRLGKIASVGDDRYILHFEIWIGNDPVDPLEVIREESRVTEKKGV